MLFIPPRLRYNWESSSKLFQEEIIMKVRIENTCTACGLCAGICPEIFNMKSDTAEVIVDMIPAEFEDTAKEASDECPVEAIVVE